MYSRIHTSTMSCDQMYPFPQVFFVDGGQQQEQHRPGQPPGCPQRGRRVGSCVGLIPTFATVVLLLFLLVFAALGFGGYLMYNMQLELRDVRKLSPALKQAQELSRANKQISLDEAGGNKDHKIQTEEKPAAHVIGRIETDVVGKTLRWEPRVGAAYTSGAVAYRLKDGALWVNQSGLYHIYSRVELIFKHCSPTSSFTHTVFVRSPSAKDTTVMEAHRAGFCSQQSGPKRRHSWTADSYLAAAVRLHRNASVLVNVTHAQFLSHSQYGNFFGLYKI
ncbi:tumor necrosis factor ligand superfamily member 6 [Syngnathoides biaculeatus]|uniref:tumor necrosis factor ligand superfamily member 6 n=1 Tax=Syngnathoides biaculeatus TaxID=300417 RepID=UPI002ADD665F|nr:tumor necrosis factor ligand superfamily member 6 [Syngnathoides biaculeatus]